MPANSLDFFDTVELSALRHDLEPGPKGTVAGQQGMPPLDADRDPHEKPISDAVEQKVRIAAGRLSEWRKEAQHELDDVIAGDPVSELHMVSRSAEGQFQSVMKMGRPVLEYSRQEAEKRRADFWTFKEDHGLARREPHYPDASKRWLMIGVLMILFLVESVANSAFLAKGNELGIVGSYIVAGGISALNILPAFLIFGPTSRYLGHISRWRSVLAVVGMFAYVGFAFGLNLGVAHYREASSTSLIGEAGRAVVERMQDTPFGLEDAESWLLLGLGCLFSIIAFLEGRKFDDSYPEYGRRHRSMVTAYAKCEREFTNIHAEVDEIRERSLDKVSRILHDARLQPEALQRIRRDWCQRIKQFDEHAAKLQQDGEALIDEYREANRIARPDGIIPMSHRTTWELPIPAIDRSDLGAPLGDGTSSEEKLRQVAEQCRSATDLICKFYKTAHDSLPPAPTAVAPAQPARQPN